MAIVNRVRAVWSGFPGGPGVSTFVCVNPATAVPAIRAFFLARAANFPDNVSIQVENTGDVFDDTTGEITSFWSTAAVASVEGTSVGAYAAPAGIAVTWLTGLVVAGRRLRGRTFMVPITVVNFETDGTPTFALIDGFRVAAEALIAANLNNLLVWHRPTAPGGSDGATAPITGALVNDKVVVLRSRRD